MTFLEKALKIQKEIQTLPIDEIGFQSLESKTQSSVRISQIIERETLDTESDLKNRLHQEFKGLGPLTQLFQDEEITEVLLISKDEIWYEKAGYLHKHSDSFVGDLTFQNLINRICEEAKLQASVEKPFADGKFLNFRVHLITAEVTKSCPQMTFRRQSANPWSFAKLLASGWAPEAAFEILQTWIHGKKSFLVVGETGSGKTSVLNSCLQQLRPNERVVILEDTAEVHVPNAASTRLLTRADGHSLLPPIDLTELVRQSLRMRPDRLVVGEVRGAEAKDLLLALSTGHQGSFGTLHACSAHQALLRLEMLVQLGAPFWSLTTIRRLIFFGVQGLVVVGRDPSGNRKLKSLHQLCAVEENGILLEPLFEDRSLV
ncbi:MAG: CpaF family protein [Bdellovibrio sp. CG10_big_fil_rev_8_21_14_0_10_47_8]|nr:MAG: CpaF family protein [Bdellovibrio sp. CG10_big_fil_rev_8_21_14_0_10_47_8]